MQSSLITLGPAPFPARVMANFCVKLITQLTNPWFQRNHAACFHTEQTISSTLNELLDFSKRHLLTLLLPRKGIVVERSACKLFLKYFNYKLTMTLTSSFAAKHPLLQSLGFNHRPSLYLFPLSLYTYIARVL